MKTKIVACEHCKGVGYSPREELKDYHKCTYSKWKVPCEWCDATGRMIEITQLARVNEKSLRRYFDLPAETREEG